MEAAPGSMVSYLGYVGSGGGGAGYNEAYEREQRDPGVIKYRYRTHPAILANIPLPIEPNVGKRLVSGAREGSHGALLVVGPQQRQQQQHTAFDSGQLWADQSQSVRLAKLDERIRSSRRLDVIEKGDDEVRRLDNDDTANGGGFKLTDGGLSGQVYVAQEERESRIAHRRAIRAGDQLLAVDPGAVETACQVADRQIERQQDQLRLIYWARDKEKQFVQADAQIAAAATAAARLQAPSNFPCDRRPIEPLDGGLCGKQPNWIASSSRSLPPMCLNFHQDDKSINCSKPVERAEETGNGQMEELNPVTNKANRNLRERLMQELEGFIEQYLNESDKLNLSYYLNEFETNNCDLSDLLANLLQNLLIKLPNAFVKYKLLDYIKQLYVEPVMSSSDKMANDDYDDDNGSDQLEQSNVLPKISYLDRDQVSMPIAMPMRTTLATVALDSNRWGCSNKHKVDLRLFEAMQWRYLLASNALMRCSPPSKSSSLYANSSELQRKRRRKQRAAEIQLLRRLHANWQVNCCQFRGALRKERARALANPLKQNNWPPLVQFNGEPANEEACQLLSGSSSDELSPFKQQQQQQEQQPGLRNLGCELELAEEWSSSGSLIDWPPASKRPYPSASVSLIDYHWNQPSCERAVTADNSTDSSSIITTTTTNNNSNNNNNNNVRLNLHLNLSQNEHGSDHENNGNNNKRGGGSTGSAQLLDKSKPRGWFNLWPAGLSLGERKLATPSYNYPDVPGTATGRLFGHLNSHHNHNANNYNKHHQFRRPMQPSWLHSGQFATPSDERRNRYLPQAAALSTSLDSLAQPKQGPLWAQNNVLGRQQVTPSWLSRGTPACSSANSSRLTTDRANVYLPVHKQLSPSLQRILDPFDQFDDSSSGYLQRGRPPPQHSDDMALLGHYCNNRILFEDNSLRPSSCFNEGARCRLLPSVGSGNASFAFRPLAGNLDFDAARRASYNDHDNGDLNFKQSVVSVWPPAAAASPATATAAAARTQYDKHQKLGPLCSDNELPVYGRDGSGGGAAEIIQATESGAFFSAGEHLTTTTTRNDAHYYYDEASEPFQITQQRQRQHQQHQASSIMAPNAIELPSALSAATTTHYNAGQADHSPTSPNGITTSLTCPYRNQSSAAVCCRDDLRQSCAMNEPASCSFGGGRSLASGGLLQPLNLGRLQRGSRCCSTPSMPMAACYPLDCVGGQKTSSMVQPPQTSWHANSASALSLAEAQASDLSRFQGNLPPPNPPFGAIQTWPPPEGGRQAQCCGSPRFECANYNETQAAPTGSLGYRHQRQPAGHFEKAAARRRPTDAQQLCPADFSPIAHDKLAPFSDSTNNDRFSCKNQPTCEPAEACEMATAESEPHHRRPRQQPQQQPQQQQVSNLAASLSARHHNQHHLSVSSNISHRTRPITNQLKDGPLQLAWHCCNELNEKDSRQHQRRHVRQADWQQSANSNFALNRHQFGQCQVDDDDEDDEANNNNNSSSNNNNIYYDHYEDNSDREQGMTAVPVQAKGRLSMSVAEQMKQQASAFVNQYNSSCASIRGHSSQRPKARQKPNLQVRRKLRVKIKKSKPILGIAIEGGFNVSGQLLPRIVCVHEDGAAYQCGKLRASDLILEVNGKSTVNMTHDEIAKTIATAYYQDQHSHIEFLIGESVQCIT